MKVVITVSGDWNDEGYAVLHGDLDVLAVFDADAWNAAEDDNYPDPIVTINPYNPTSLRALADLLDKKGG